MQLSLISRIELVSVVLSSLSKFFNLVVILNSWTIGLYSALAIQMIVSITMDVFLLSQLEVSLQCKLGFVVQAVILYCRTMPVT